MASVLDVLPWSMAVQCTFGVNWCDFNTFLCQPLPCLYKDVRCYLFSVVEKAFVWRKVLVVEKAIVWPSPCFVASDCIHSASRLFMVSGGVARLLSSQQCTTE